MRRVPAVEGRTSLVLLLDVLLVAWPPAVRRAPADGWLLGAPGLARGVVESSVASVRAGGGHSLLRHWALI